MEYNPKQMKLLKKLIFLIISAIALVLVIALFSKKDFTLEKRIVINLPSNEVFNYLKFLKHQDEYNPWQQSDSKKETLYEGEDGTIGFKYIWNSDSEFLGSGKQEIKALVYPERIETEILLSKPRNIESTTYFELHSNGNRTEVVWGINGKVPYPKNFMLLFQNLEDRVGKHLTKGLQNLKKQLEG